MEERILMAVTTSMENHLVGLPISEVKRVARQRAETIYPIPKTSEEVLGLVNDNGLTFPVFDLSQLITSEEIKLPPVPLSEEYVAIIVTTLQGYQIGLAVARDPDFYSVEEGSEKATEKIFSGQFRVENSSEIIHTINVANVFPNVEVAANSVENKSDEGDLDMSQYVLSE